MNARLAYIVLLLAAVAVGVLCANVMYNAVSGSLAYDRRR